VDILAASAGAASVDDETPAAATVAAGFGIAPAAAAAAGGGGFTDAGTAPAAHAFREGIGAPSLVVFASCAPPCAAPVPMTAP
jgi:hypothetical protein